MIKDLRIFGIAYLGMFFYACIAEEKQVVIYCTACKANVESELLKQDQGTTFYNVKISKTKDQHIKSYLMEVLQNDIVLKTPQNNSIPCSFVHVEETGGILPYETVIVGFEAEHNDKNILEVTPSIDL